LLGCARNDSLDAAIARSDATTQSPANHAPANHAPVIVIHCAAHAVAALTAAATAERSVTLLSAADAGIYAGPGWWREVIAAARAAAPAAQCAAVLDCGDEAGAAQAAIRAGVEVIVFTGPADVAARLADIAARGGLRLLTTRPIATLDLGDDFFTAHEILYRRCVHALASRPERGPRTVRQFR
jgi:hypothetical protein